MEIVRCTDGPQAAMTTASAQRVGTFFFGVIEKARKFVGKKKPVARAKPVGYSHHLTTPTCVPSAIHLKTASPRTRAFFLSTSFARFRCAAHIYRNTNACHPSRDAGDRHPSQQPLLASADCMLMSNPPFSSGADQPAYHHAHHHPHAHMHAYNPYPRPSIVKRETLDSHYGPLAQTYQENLPYDANGMIAAGHIPPQSASPASSSSSSSLVLLAPYGSTRDSSNVDARAARDAHHKLLALPEDEEEAEMSTMDQFNAEYATGGGWPPRKDDGTIKRRSSKGQCPSSR
jgi:hypothetical protein